MRKRPLLGRLILLYDDNLVSLAGQASLSFSEDVPRRFEACGWHTLTVADGNDLEAIDAAIRAARAETARPSLIAVRTVIGYGAPKKQGTHEAHGEPLGDEELNGAKKALGWPTEPRFLIPDAVRAHFRPEFLNRIDDIIVFDRLTRDDVRRIVEIQLAELRRRLSDRRIDLVLDDEALDLLAERGFDPLYGARPLKRVIQKDLADRLATALLEDSISDGSTVKVTVADGELHLA